MKNIECIGIVGGGKMGSSIFDYLSQFEICLVWINRSNAEKAKKKYARKIKRALKNELISKAAHQFKAKNHQITENPKEVYKCNLIIESISEKCDAKKELIANLIENSPKNTIIASNSSSLTPSQLYNNQTENHRIIGLHFFYPVGLTKIAELITTDQTNAKIINQIKHFLKKFEIRYLQQNEQSAFIFNRIMLDVQAAAFNYAVEKKCSFAEIDSIAKETLCPPGIFEMMDLIGLDLIYTAANNYQKISTPKEHYKNLISFLKSKIDKNEVGIKTQKGFFDYQKPHSQTDNKINTEQTEIFLANSFANAYYCVLNNYKIDKDLLDYGLYQYTNSEVEEWLKRAKK